MIDIRIGHAGLDVEQHVVGVALGAYVHAVHVQVNRRGFHRRGIDRDRLTFGRVRRVVVIADRQAAQTVVEVDDQRLSRVHLERRCRIDVVAGHVAVRCRSALDRVTEDEHVLHGCRNGVELGVTLVRGKRYFKRAIFRREDDRLGERRTHAEIARSGHILRPATGRHRTGREHKRARSDTGSKRPRNPYHAGPLPDRTKGAFNHQAEKWGRDGSYRGSQL